MKRSRIKKDKSSYLRAFFVSTTFCFVALFYVVPKLGKDGMVWVFLTVLITAINGRNAFTKDAVQSKKVVQEKEVEPEETPDESLYKLNYLYQKDLITCEDYDRQRKEILSKF